MSAAGILNAKMEKVFGWVKSHGGKTSKQQQQDQQQQQQLRQRQQRSRSEDGLEMRDFPSSNPPLSQRSLEEVFRGHEEAMDLNNLLAGRPLPSLDLLPPFYHDKRSNSNSPSAQETASSSSQPPNIIAASNIANNGKAIPPTPSTPRPSPPNLSKTRTAITSFMDNPLSHCKPDW